MTSTPKNANARSQVSVRVPDTILQDMDRIADALDRDRSWVMIQAFQTYLDQEGAEILQEMDGIANIENGEVTDFDRVMQKASAIVDKTQKNIPKKPV